MAIEEQAMRASRIVVCVAAAGLVLAAGCSGNDGDAAGDGRIDGEITVLTQRTDIVGTVFERYKQEFKKIHPDVTVKFEAITDYEGEVKIRMNTEEYGDVLLIPATVTNEQLPTFFEPLGTVEELGEKYRFVKEQAFEGQVYGIAITGNAFGFVYNKKVWQQAGITAPPRSPEEFLDALRAIKAKTSAIPLYTNYHQGWPLGQWEDARGGVAGKPDAVARLADQDAPWAPGTPHHIIDTLLFDVVANELTEPDPTTTDWESSKRLLGEGKIATMMLGSWSITQMRQAATDPKDIGYLPFPVQVDGKFHSTIGGDYKNAINIHSENKDAARAWIEWFAEKSNYATDEGGITPTLGGPEPDTLADFKTAGVELFELDHGKDAIVSRIDKASEVGLTQPTYRQALVDAARGASGKSKQEIFDDLNKRWAEARAQVG
jgi:raffinose/stachyose/melibiose transport system substrate-binding protein